MMLTKVQARSQFPTAHVPLDQHMSGDFHGRLCHHRTAQSDVHHGALLPMFHPLADADFGRGGETSDSLPPAPPDRDLTPEEPLLLSAAWVGWWVET